MCRVCEANGELKNRSLRRLLSPIFLKLLANALAFCFGQIIDKQLAIQVINFMLNTNSQQAFGFLFLSVSIAIQIADANMLGALHFFKVSGDRQASFLGYRHAVFLQDFRIYQDAGIVLLLRDVGNEQALMHIDLRGSQSDAGSGVHCLEHVVDQNPQIVVHIRHRYGLFA